MNNEKGMMRKMKKFLLSTLTFCLVCCLATIPSVNASTVLSDSYLNDIKEQVCFLNEKIEISKLNFKDYKILLDIENNESYALIVIDNDGYIISGIKNKTISEYSLTKNSNPYKNNMSDTLLYYGPMNYLFKSNESIVDIYSNRIISSNLRMENINDNDIENLKKLNTEFLNNCAPVPVKTRASGSWVGAPASRFSRYNSSNWRNKSNICGPIAAAIMFAYFDDYVGFDVIPDNVRKQNSSSPGTLITKMVAETPLATSTVPSTLATGIRGFIQKYSPNKYIKATSMSTNPFSTVKNSCSSSRPICVGLLNSLGSSYGNHWVTAYQCKETGAFVGYYKCIDNWGNYSKEITSSWAMGAVSIGY